MTGIVLTGTLVCCIACDDVWDDARTCVCARPYLCVCLSDGMAHRGECVVSRRHTTIAQPRTVAAAHTLSRPRPPDTRHLARRAGAATGPPLQRDPFETLVMVFGGFDGQTHRIDGRVSGVRPPPLHHIRHALCCAIWHAVCNEVVRHKFRLAMRRTAASMWRRAAGVAAVYDMPTNLTVCARTMRECCITGLLATAASRRHRVAAPGPNYQLIPAVRMGRAVSAAGRA